eukprot:m.137443 g.137443  ORF g.137443 m.137443 type:complete len:72 (+) comp13973_c0_seq2:5158-5373(+)
MKTLWWQNNAFNVFNFHNYVRSHVELSASLNFSLHASAFLHASASTNDNKERAIHAAIEKLWRLATLLKLG